MPSRLQDFRDAWKQVFYRTKEQHTMTTEAAYWVDMPQVIKTLLA